MKIPINLASQPFRRDRAMVVASTVVSLLLVVTLGILIRLAMQDNRQLADVRHEVGLLKTQVQTVTREQARMDAVIHKPENETVLERSVFLNTLLKRKGISWNQIFTDLEKTIPYNVKLVRIRPTVDDQGHVLLDMIMASDTAGPANDALKAFRTNALFSAVVMKGFSPPTQSEPLFRVSLDVTYAQKL
jgi:type IV pilus assembly protein PilN